MKKIILSLLCLSFLIQAGAQHYKNFKVSVYTRAYEVEKMKDSHWLDSTWRIISAQVQPDKIYLETHRDLLIVPDATLRKAIRFFREKGMEVGGGITYTIDESNSFETFCYTNPEHRKKVQEIAEHTARYFDDFILDDFFFTSCKCPLCIEAKGGMSWTQYRLKLMTEAGKSLILDPARKVNPNVRVIIKYPNWYDHFQGLGFDLEHGPALFDGVWTGTETRDPSSAQHLQNYLSYNVFRYLDNLRPGYNFGGWVDSGGSHMGLYRYAEQLWLTLFAKAPEITLFAYNQLLRQPELGKTATETFLLTDQFLGELGKPKGIASYKPFHATGEDFLQNYLGMIGLPMDMLPYFPVDRKVVLLTEQAKSDPLIASKIREQLLRGGDVVVTTGLVKAIPDQIATIAEVRCSDLKALIDDFGWHGKSTRPLLIPQVHYLTNDSWEVVSAGNPLTKGVIGYPILLRCAYAKGNMYILTIPDSFADLYAYPDKALNMIRLIMSKDLDIRIEGPSMVGLFVYDNGTFIVESFLDEPVTVYVALTGGQGNITELTENKVYSIESNKFSITLEPHTFKVFKK
ncbi:MAG TPA: hypothetical protein PLM86_06005 [Bacteroidales bacterium]|nr:MAG: hypothetical protein BWX93_00119 [Bacteroidetes bacterium ADurb.Bin139]HOG25722.1 hypothetical protein [Bacteroidales bacterium]HOR10922.1 hypothetical protein [Bacteroidales bacterium]HPB78252.1 hypothetical protein [Bacteroidales bacterium]HPK38387.1 hypothetical protein [Bacteroidales bacterium]